ncbi:hypothetical protein L228DRAFT_268776 [Xylona heveae TC161]|uniref:Trafficking protein particle complex II-specific subunit 65 IgD3 domain-containing protein n=1 Tax=Xylona heveae (strain CBS 132557 / TC161) TaxID=1328760 RepID=A0A165GKI0_XYLHT|nr:hypothetical protein L228DRAFT_268776 [Xylona heveae TC161]KZF22301.1 hypothetical protein L228DRAFT_268776 [Xylona heveae TC161]
MDFDESELFAGRSILDTVVPFATEVPIEETIASSLDDAVQSSLLTSIPQRRLLFFDESLTVYIVLQTPYIPENKLRSYLSRLNLTLEAHLVNLQPNHHQEGLSHGIAIQQKELIYSGEVEQSVDPLTIVERSAGGAEEASDRSIFVLWKKSIVLTRPRIRPHSPMIYLSAIGSLRPVDISDNIRNNEDYLPSGVPVDLNLFESLRNDSGTAGAPRLSATRVSRVAPVSRPSRGVVRQLINNPRSFPVVPAMTSRVRYSKLHPQLPRPIIIASLSFDIAPYAEYEIRFEKVDVDLIGGSAEALDHPNKDVMPLICHAKDEVSFLYRLTSENSFGNSSDPYSTVRSLEITVSSVALVSEECRPRVTMKWKATVDFSVPLNPTLGGQHQLMQSVHRPRSVPSAPSLAATLAQGPLGKVPTLGPDPSETVQPPWSTTAASLGLIFTFSGPEKVYVGERFRWDIVIVNRSAKPRKLALMAVPRRRKGDVKKHLARPSGSSWNDRRDKPVTDAVADENFVYALQRNALTEPADLICLSTEVRVGPLAPESCHSAEMQFLALAVGPLYVEAIRVVDLITQEATDIWARDLPSIASFQRKDS